ncbi:MAG: sensor histidine kinase [Firmicutes bacterium]|nr:sensor histidine kinase [Bacillota bacterium]
MINNQQLLAIIIRWLFLHGIALIIMFVVKPGIWGATGLLLASSAVSTGLSIVYLRRSRQVNFDIEQDHMDPTLQIASQTLPYMRRGLNEETARKTAEIIQKIADVASVAVTDHETVLAYIGTGADHHKPGGPIITKATRDVLVTGEIKIVLDSRELNCPMKGCPLESAVVVPLQCKGEVVGTIKLYRVERGEVPPTVVKLAVGVSQLLGMQMELAELDRQVQLVTKAELDALHAQINPHFLFNTLNTIIMFSRTNPETARRLLIRLASFFRHALKRHGHFNSLREEIEYLNTYLVLERARFREKLRVVRDINEELLEYQVPVLTIQPLVENAIKHGILPKPEQGTVQVTARKIDSEMVIIIRDDGVGIEDDRVNDVLRPGYGSGNGVGLSNVHERLKVLFGEDYGLRIVSVPGEGTSIYVRVPLLHGTAEKEGKERETQSADSGR